MFCAGAARGGYITVKKVKCQAALLCIVQPRGQGFLCNCCTANTLDLCSDAYRCRAVHRSSMAACVKALLAVAKPGTYLDQASQHASEEIMTAKSASLNGARQGQAAGSTRP